MDDVLSDSYKTLSQFLAAAKKKQTKYYNLEINKDYFRHTKDKNVKSSQHGFTDGKKFLTNLINFYDEMMVLVGERNVYCLP